jgi:hypothetical protein
LALDRLPAAAVASGPDLLAGIHLALAVDVVLMLMVVAAFNTKLKRTA